MSRPLCEQVADPAWQLTARRWVAEQLPGREVAAFELDRVYPWSALYRVEADGDRWWFKINCPAQAFEGRLHTTIAQLVPDAFDAPVAIHPGHGWVLSADFGGTLAGAEKRSEWTNQTWVPLVAEAARIQRVLCDHAEAMLATGMPDFRPSSVLGRFDRLVDLFVHLPDGHPARLDAQLRSRLPDGRARLAAAVDVLDGSALPSSWNHDDLHPDNVYTRGGQFRIFDFGDSNWAHPMGILCVPFAMLTARPQERGELESESWPQLLAAYAEVWQISVDQAADEWAAVQTIRAVNHSATWLSCLQQASAQDWQRWGSVPLEYFARVIDA